jgi:hypothetical protein
MAAPQVLGIAFIVHGFDGSPSPRVGTAIAVKSATVIIVLAVVLMRLQPGLGIGEAIGVQATEVVIPILVSLVTVVLVTRIARQKRR